MHADAASRTKDPNYPTDTAQPLLAAQLRLAEGQRTDCSAFEATTVAS